MPHPKNSETQRLTLDSDLGTLRLQARQLLFAGLLSNLRDFLLERPAKVTTAGESFFSAGGFGEGVVDNLREFFRIAPRGKLKSELLTERSGGFVEFGQNLKELFARNEEVISAGSADSVLEIWSKSPRFSRAQAFSVAIHAGLLALLLRPLLPMFRPVAKQSSSNGENVVTLSPFHLIAPTAEVMRGGGSSHDKAPSAHGKAPKFATIQFAAPTSHPVLNPKVSRTATVLGDPNITLPNVNASNWGNPLSNLVGTSLGANGGNGIGDGPGNGLGKGEMYGAGQEGPPAGYSGYGYPECVYCPNAQYSDEAVKAKHQGVVLVDALITPDGRAIDVHVIKSLGLGLDENAVAAVKTWRFRPATGPNGKPAAVEQTIEVEFRLI